MDFPKILRHNSILICFKIWLWHLSYKVFQSKYCIITTLDSSLPFACPYAILQVYLCNRSRVVVAFASIVPCHIKIFKDFQYQSCILLYLSDTNGSVVNTGDVKPTMPPSQTPPQYMVQPVGAQPLIFDRGLMQAVCNAKHFVSTSFEGAVLMDEHQVGSRLYQGYD